MKKINFLIILFSLTMLWAADPYLSIKKVASPQYVEGNNIINYYLVITNTSNATNPPIYNDLTVYDKITLSNTDLNVSDLNITITEIDEASLDHNFTCVIDKSNNDSQITCDGNITGGSRIIRYTIVAPNEPMQISNTATLSLPSEGNFTSSSITVTVFPNYANTDYERDLCYELPQYDQAKCSKAGAFYYGEECPTSVLIKHQTENNLQAVHIYKSYTAPEIFTDSCYVDIDTNVQCETDDTLGDLLHKESSTYLESAFDTVLDFSIGNIDSSLLNDHNFTIFDEGTRSTNINNPQNDEDYIAFIALIAQYQRTTNTNDGNSTVEEYIYPCNAGSSAPPPFGQVTSAGINDVDMSVATLNTLNQAKYIPYGVDGEGYKKVGTKIVNQPFVLGVTYLDENNEPAVYSGIYFDDKGREQTEDATILLRYSKDGVTVDGDVWAANFTPGIESILTLKYSDNPNIQSIEYPMITEAFSNGAIEMQFLDYASFFNQIGGFKCASSAAQSSLCLVPACLNSDTQILEVFPVEHYPLVATCVYGDGGGAAPCESSAYNGNCGGTIKTISPSIYNDPLGCAMCLADATSPGITSNPFSVRPYSYELSVPNAAIGENNEPVYKAGQEYPIDLKATTADLSIPTSDGYTTTLTGHNPPTVIASIGLNTNIAPVSCPYTDKESQTIRFSDGYAGTPVAGITVTEANISYSNVGDVNLTIMDQSWTSIDWDGVVGDPECILDSNETDPTKDPLNRGRVGCRLVTSKLMRFVPDHFNIEANLTNHNTSANFTYLNDFNDTGGVTDMAASLHIDIAAMNDGDENVTTNYIDGCYAKDNNLSLTFDPFTISPDDSLTHMLYYNVIDDNKSSISIPTPRTNIISLPEPLQSTSTSFTAAGNGTAGFEYKLNFNRTIDKEVQAFAINLTDVNMTDVDNAEGNQTGITGQTAFMHYAKARPSVGIGNTYDNIQTEIVNTPVLVHVYCNPGGVFSLDFPACTNLSLSSYAGANWWLSDGHNADTGDGYVILKEIEQADIIEGSGAPYFDTNATTINIVSGGKDNNVTIFRGPNPSFPLTVNIELNSSSDAWLIHNPFGILADPSPFYKIKFIIPSTWVGVGGTGSVVDTEVNTNTNKRMNW